MRKVAKILFLVGGICSIVTAVSLFACAVVCIVFSTPVLETIADSLIEYVPENAAQGRDAAIIVLRSMFISTAVVCLIWMVFSILNSVFSFKAWKQEDKGLFIKCIVFSALSGETLSLVAAILSLIAHMREGNKKVVVEGDK